MVGVFFPQNPHLNREGGMVVDRGLFEQIVAIVGRLIGHMRIANADLC